MGVTRALVFTAEDLPADWAEEPSGGGSPAYLALIEAAIARLVSEATAGSPTHGLLLRAHEAIECVLKEIAVLPAALL